MPRSGLTPDQIVEAAGDAMDREGAVESLTLARLAEQFGVKTPSLYNHVGGLDDLVYRVGLKALEELAQVCRDAAMGRSGVEALQHIAVAYREFVRAHPATYSLTQVARPRDDRWLEVTRRVMEPLLVTLAGMGIEGDDAIHAVRVLRSALHGFVSLEANGGFGIDLSVDESFERLVATVVVALAR